MDNDQYQLDGWLKRAQAGLLTALIRLLRWTWRVRTHDAFILSDAIEAGGAVIAFWHGEQLTMVPLHVSDRIAGLASHSPDGALAAAVIHRLGYRSLRGSSSRGGLQALHGCRNALEDGISPALAVDGPRGPRHEVRLGALGVAAHAQRPIVYVVSRTSRSWRLNSWDRFQIPWPGAHIDVAYGLMPAPGTDRAALEAGANELRERMLALSDSLRTSEVCPSGALAAP